MRIRVFLFFIIMGFYSHLYGQYNTTLFGFGIKPIFPSNYLRTGTINFSDSTTNFSLSQSNGYTVGAFVRRGITKKLSFETGLLYSKRNYDFTINDSNTITGGNYSIIGYEVPITALVFVQLGQQMWMNVALGGSIDIYPSDIFTYKTYFLNYAARKSKINAGVLANIGFEYRTLKSGTFYLGTSYHRSMSSIYDAIIEYYPTGNYNIKPRSTGKTSLEGDYLTIDLRYYFHENPDNKKSKTQKRD